LRPVELVGGAPAITIRGCIGRNTTYLDYRGGAWLRVRELSWLDYGRKRIGRRDQLVFRGQFHRHRYRACHVCHCCTYKCSHIGAKHHPHFERTVRWPLNRSHERTWSKFDQLRSRGACCQKAALECPGLHAGHRPSRSCPIVAGRTELVPVVSCKRVHGGQSLLRGASTPSSSRARSSSSS